MNERFEPLDCQDDDIISIGGSIFRGGVFKGAINKSVRASIGQSINNLLNSNGLRINWGNIVPDGTLWLFPKGVCFEILRPGFRRWRKGKVVIRLSVDFYVEREPEESDTSETETIALINDIHDLTNQDEQQGLE